jgi:hypothetical protein
VAVGAAVDTEKPREQHRPVRGTPENLPPANISSQSVIQKSIPGSRRLSISRNESVKIGIAGADGSGTTEWVTVDDGGRRTRGPMKRKYRSGLDLAGRTETEETIEQIGRIAYDSSHDDYGSI